MNIHMNAFSISSVKAAQKALKAYKNGLELKCVLFVEKLAELGISVAEENIGSFGKYVLIAAETSERGRSGVQSVVYATNMGLIRSQWLNSNGGIETADVSPLLMAEFGSGLRAQKNPRGKEFGMGTGTFPGQKHAEDPEGWWYMDLDGEWHHSYGLTPTMPMQKAADAMFLNIQRIAKEVFGT